MTPHKPHKPQNTPLLLQTSSSPFGLPFVFPITLPIPSLFPSFPFFLPFFSPSFPLPQPAHTPPDLTDHLLLFPFFLHMLSRHLLLGLALAALSQAIIPNVHMGASAPDSYVEPGHLSLPHLLEKNSLSDILLTWQPVQNVQLDTGRLLFSKAAGGIWSIPHLAGTRDEWTIETVFRYSGSSRNSPNSAKNNGLAFWLVDPSHSKDSANFGGPSQFDGFQFLVNNKEQPGLGIYASDGSKKAQNALSASIGDCAFNYLDSQVPFTLRISYLRLKSWFKVQVDNNLCFKTDAIVLGDDINDFKFGVTANIDPSSSDFFELLGLNVWSQLTSDAIDDHGLMVDGQLKVEYKTVTAGNPTHTPDAILERVSLMERIKQQRQQLLRDQIEKENGPIPGSTPSYDSGALEALSAHMASLEKAINLLSQSSDSRLLEESIGDLKQIQAQQQQVFAGLQDSFTDFKSTIVSHNAEIIQTISKINQKLIGEVREQQYSFDEIGKKVELLMLHHKEIKYQYQKDSNDASGASDVFSSIVRWVLVPVFVVLLLLAFAVYRLRRDIKHAKLL